MAIGKLEDGDKQIVETYLIIINYLPVLVDESLSQDGLTIQEAFLGIINEAKAKETANQEFHRVFNEIFTKATRDNKNPVLVSCPGSPTVILYKHVPIKEQAIKVIES